MIAYTAAFYENWDGAFADELVTRLEIPLETKVGSLSRGQRGKLALMLALSFRPELLVLDDPVSGLDPIVRHEFLEQIIELIQAEGRTVLLSSHILDEVERIADRIMIVNRGRLLVNDSLDSLKERTKRVRLEFESAAPEAPFNDAVRCVRQDRTLTLTLRDLSDERMVALRGLGAKSMDVEDLGLSELFVDTVKGDN
jgi:ABC-2 type transport system ATP-binding protein